ncbi:hypothetical protein Tco_0138799 [Tanacetum coccineum]
MASAAAKPCQGDSSELYLITGSTPDDCDEVLKLKNFKKDATLNLFKSTNQERYEHVGLEVTSSQDGKVNKIAKQDYAWLMISRCSRSHSRQAKEQAQVQRSIRKWLTYGASYKGQQRDFNRKAAIKNFPEKARVNGDFQKFNAIYKHLQRKSGENKVDHIETSKLNFQAVSNGRKFTLDHAWRVLKKHPKWDAADSLDLADYNELFDPDARPCPAGKPRPAKKQIGDDDEHRWKSVRVFIGFFIFVF